HWVIQGDGLRLLPEAAPGTTEGTALNQVQARLTQLRDLGEISLATLTLDAPAGLALQLTLSGPRRQQARLHGRLQVQLDPDWVHVMPVRQT
ncbi:MAG TPA: ABC transporter ATP-binding protein, partial [Macromonas sp.]|nr:ABC transporter ATP-binding protein [Macromonas sp.]